MIQHEANTSEINGRMVHKKCIFCRDEILRKKFDEQVSAMLLEDISMKIFVFKSAPN
jgi:hypothetical protein